MKKLGIISLSLLLAHTASYSSDIMQQSLDYISFSSKTMQESPLKKAFLYNKQPSTSQAIIAAHYLASNPAQPNKRSGTGAREAKFHKLTTQAKQEKIIPLLTEKNSGILNKFDMQLADTLMDSSLRELLRRADVPRSLTLPSNISPTSKILNSVFNQHKKVQYLTINSQDVENDKLIATLQILRSARDHNTKDILTFLFNGRPNRPDTDSCDNYPIDFEALSFINNNPELKNFCNNNQNLPELSLIINVENDNTLSSFDPDSISNFSGFKNIIINGNHLTKVEDETGFNERIDSFTFPDSVIEFGDNVLAESTIKTFTALLSLQKVGKDFLSNCRELKELKIASYITGLDPDCLKLCKNLTSLEVNEQLFEELGEEDFFNTQNFPNLKKIKVLRPHDAFSTLTLQ